MSAAAGTGHAIKLLHNMVCHTNFMVVAEAGRLAGARRHSARDRRSSVFNAGNARSYISEQRFPNHILSGKFDGRSTVSNLAKDLAMADSLRRRIRRGERLHGADRAEFSAKAIQKGLGGAGFHAPV
jgi:3-hydroxyisobutyrate dehydrogenase